MVYLCADSHPFEQLPLDSDPTESRTHDLLIASLVPNRYTNKEIW